VHEVGVQAVAEGCNADQRYPPVIVLVSSLAVARPSGATPIVVSDRPVPVSNSGRSEFAGEQVTLGFADVLPITVVQPRVVFGPRDRMMCPSKARVTHDGSRLHGLNAFQNGLDAIPAHRSGQGRDEPATCTSTSEPARQSIIQWTCGRFRTDRHRTEVDRDLARRASAPRVCATAQTRCGPA
jgi:hypothetical protein